MMSIVWSFFAGSQACHAPQVTSQLQSSPSYDVARQSSCDVTLSDLDCQS